MKTRGDQADGSAHHVSHGGRVRHHSTDCCLNGISREGQEPLVPRQWHFLVSICSWVDGARHCVGNLLGEGLLIIALRLPWFVCGPAGDMLLEVNVHKRVDVPSSPEPLKLCCKVVHSLACQCSAKANGAQVASLVPSGRQSNGKSLNEISPSLARTST